VPLCAHDLAALEDRLQQGGRVRVHARPERRPARRDAARSGPRAAAQRRRRAARSTWPKNCAPVACAPTSTPKISTRGSVEIFRHARTSLEESGANTLYLAIGFLKWFETPQSTKPRRAPLLLLPLVDRTHLGAGGLPFRARRRRAAAQPDAAADAAPRLHGVVPARRHAARRTTTASTCARCSTAFREAALAMPRWEVENDGVRRLLLVHEVPDVARPRRARGTAAESRCCSIWSSARGWFAQEVPEVARERARRTRPERRVLPQGRRQLAARGGARGGAGRSFVLEGPPGTGKSQTITNLIAQALANGKRVLFVAEKRAALEVVQRRLAEVGLGAVLPRTALEQERAEGGARTVAAALEVGQRREPAEWAQLAGELQRQRTQLNAYVHDLHRRASTACRCSGDGEWSTLRDSGRACRCPSSAKRRPRGCVAARGRSANSPRRGDARRARAGAVVGRAARGLDARPRARGAAAARGAGATAAMHGAGARVARPWALARGVWRLGPSRISWHLLLSWRRCSKAPSLPPAALLRSADWRAAEGELANGQPGRHASAMPCGSRCRPLAPRAARSWISIGSRRRTARGGAFFLCVGGDCEHRARSSPPVANSARSAGAGSCASDLQRGAAGAREEAAPAGAAAAQVLGAHWRDGLPTGRSERVAQWVREVRRVLVQVPGSLHAGSGGARGVRRAARRLARWRRGAAEGARRAASAHDEWLAAMRRCDDVAALDDDEAFGRPTRLAASAPSPAYAGLARRHAERCATLRVPRARRCGARATGRPLVQRTRAATVARPQLATARERTFLEAWLDVVHTREPALARFRGQDHERTIARFGELDRSAIAPVRRGRRRASRARVPQLRDTQVASSELGMLERELKKQRKHKPVRKLLAEIPGLLGRLAPCMLMSPLSVAQYLGRAGTPLRPRRVRRGVADPDVGRGRRDRARQVAGGGRRQPAAAADDVLPAPGQGRRDRRRRDAGGPRERARRVRRAGLPRCTSTGTTAAGTSR
jgi:RecA/RadA recombinase